MRVGDYVRFKEYTATYFKGLLGLDTSYEKTFRITSIYRNEIFEEDIVTIEGEKRSFLGSFFELADEDFY